MSRPRRPVASGCARAVALVALALGPPGIAGCRTPATAPLAGEDAPVLVFTAISDPGRTISGVTLRVEGPGIPEPLVFGLGRPDTAGMMAPASLSVPTGPARIFEATGHTGPSPSHRGTDTVDVTAAGAELRIVLRKLAGPGVGDSSVQDYVIAIDDSPIFASGTDSTAAAPGARVDFTVEVRTPGDLIGLVPGTPVADLAVTWGSANPDVLAVGTGRCTTGLDGTCGIPASVSPEAAPGDSALITASANGVAAAVIVHIE